MNIFIHLRPRLASIRSLRPSPGISIPRVGLRASPFSHPCSLRPRSRYINLTRALRNEPTSSSQQAGESQESSFSPEELKTILQEVKRPKVFRPIAVRTKLTCSPEYSTYTVPPLHEHQVTVLVVTLAFVAAATQTNNSVTSWQAKHGTTGPFVPAIDGNLSREVEAVQVGPTSLTRTQARPHKPIN